MTDSSDRRRFFRIHDNIGVSYRVIQEEEMSQPQAEAIQPANTLLQLADCNKKINLALGQVKLREPLVGELIETIDQKLNCVIAQLELESQLTQSLAHKVQEVNISACGMALHVDEPLAEGTLLALELLLLPGHFFIHAHGVVVSSRESEDGEAAWYTRVDFRGLSGEDQETLIQHIVKRQSAQIKRQKDALALSSRAE